MNRIMLRVIVFLAFSPVMACSKDNQSSNDEPAHHMRLAETTIDISVNKLRQFCGACHAVGDLKFITSDNNQYVWNYIYTNNAPNSQKKWADQIYKVLNWPNGVPPAFDQLMVPPNQDWMPKGSKRTNFATDKVGDKSTREFILESIAEGS